MAYSMDRYDRHDFFPFHLGNFTCIALCDGGLEYALEAMITNAPRSDVEAYLQINGLSPETIATPFTYPYVNTGKHKILVDMGTGNLFPTTGRFLQSMNKAGISPDSIDSIISHAHPDHVGEQ